MWDNFLINEINKDYYKKLMDFVSTEYKNHTCYPDFENIFNVFNICCPKDIKVVILGQDPYHGKNQAHGLSFSVLCDKLPPSLKNIYKEISSDLGCSMNQDGNLTYLAKQGVFLLNTILTVREGIPMSHKNKGWEEFTDNVIRYINLLEQPIVFLLWGREALKKRSMLNNKNHLVLISSHPSPLGAYQQLLEHSSFFGSKFFSKTNQFLIQNNIKPINWCNSNQSM